MDGSGTRIAWRESTFEGEDGESAWIVGWGDEEKALSSVRILFVGVVPPREEDFDDVVDIVCVSGGLVGEFCLLARKREGGNMCIPLKGTSIDGGVEGVENEGVEGSAVLLLLLLMVEGVGAGLEALIIDGTCLLCRGLQARRRLPVRYAN